MARFIPKDDLGENVLRKAQAEDLQVGTIAYVDAFRVYGRVKIEKAPDANGQVVFLDVDENNEPIDRRRSKMGIEDFYMLVEPTQDVEMIGGRKRRARRTRRRTAHKKRKTLSKRK